MLNMASHYSGAKISSHSHQWLRRTNYSNSNTQDPSNRYVNANFFVPGGGYIGVIDTYTKEAIALFRVTAFSTDSQRSIHMSFWSTDGSAIIMANLHGKAVERINVGRDENNLITQLTFDKSASIGLKDLNVTDEATFFTGTNAFGRSLIGAVTGDYGNADLGPLTPSGECKEDGCTGGTGSDLGRKNNLPICPNPSTNDNIYVTLAGGGLFVVDVTLTPMKIVGEYTGSEVNGAGCAGVQVDDTMYVDSGVSAGDAGATQSAFTVCELSKME